MKPAPFTCPACGTAYPVSELDPRWAWACSACDQIVAPGGAPTRWLYARASTAAGPRLHRSFGQFQLREEVGRGGMGVVYHAWDRDRARHVALKILLSGEFSSPEHLERFAREARSAALASHPNLVRVHDIGWLEERAYFTMDLVDGPTLQEVLERRGTLPVPEAVRIAAGIARGLAAAHAAAVVHRDVKPANVVLTAEGIPRLTDFGLARAPTGLADRLTRTDQLMGTPTYMAPEQLTSSRAVDARTDQYALGAVLYEMVSGTTPYLGDDPVKVMSAVARAAPTPIRRRLPSLPVPVGTMIDKAMARDPERRYPTTDALADDLERFLRDEP
ncbi:MAG: serine/threonine-protein kinase, partial [Myxococcota bacterium]